jgi:diguanylate cyclase (GGDEF)-like protein
VCRNGGEEFLMLLPGSAADEASVLAERVRKSIANAWIEEVGNITLSIGVAAWCGEDVALEATLKQADAALYQAKKAGRNCVFVSGKSVSLLSQTPH